jgi:hypothetical protein
MALVESLQAGGDFEEEDEEEKEEAVVYGTWTVEEMSLQATSSLQGTAGRDSGSSSGTR